MGKRSSQESPTAGQFVGIGKQHNDRRQNATQGQVTRRKLFPQIKPEQRGTWMEGFIKDHYKDLERMANDGRSNGPFSMSWQAADGRVRDIWHDGVKSNPTSKIISKYMKDNGTTMAEARRRVGGLNWVQFGADPKSR